MELNWVMWHHISDVVHQRPDALYRLALKLAQTPAPHPAPAPGLSYGSYRLHPQSTILCRAWSTSAPSNSPCPSGTHHETTVCSASHLGVAWWGVGLPRPTLKPLRT